MISDKLKKFVYENKLFVFILLTALIVRLIFYFSYHEIWWDSGVYIGMGKHIWSLGSIGLWEHIRPILWPFILGFFWFVKIDAVILGRILELLVTLGCISLVYLIGKELYNKKIGLIASAIFAFSSIFFFLGFHIYTEIPSLLFVLLGFYVFLKQRYYLAGLFIGLAFLAKFPSGLYIVVLGLALLFFKSKLRETVKNIVHLALGLLTVIVPFFVLNYVFYGSALLPLIDARETILNVLGCNYLRYNPWHYYFKIIFFDNFLNIFAVLGLILFFKKFNRKNLVVLFALLIPFIYFTQMHCRDYRYLVLFIPFVAYFAALGLVFVFDWLFGRRKKAFFVFVLLVLAVSIVLGVVFYVDHETEVYSDARIGYFKFLEDKQVTGEVWSSNPLVSVYSDDKIKKIYYPVYNKEVAVDFFDYLQKDTDKIDYVFLDNCGGGIICHPDDNICLEKTENIISFLGDNFDLVYNETQGRCYYWVYG